MPRLLPLLLIACGAPPADPNVPFTFEVPAGTTGLTLIVSGPAGPDDFLGLDALTDPAGKAVVRDFGDVAQAGRRQSGQSGQGVVAFRVPLADDLAAEPLPSGTWTAKVGAVRGNPKLRSVERIPILLTTDVKLQATADTLDLDVYVPKGLDLHGTTLEARWALAFGLFDRLYGWKRGDVRLHEVDARFLSIAGTSPIDAAMRLGNGAQSGQVVLTNVLDVDEAGAGNISGLSCVPGAARTAGTPCSAVIVSLRPGSEPWHDAAALVHELGHFAGLSHSTEFSGQPDDLSDTPRCTDLSKAALATCPDHDNLMFPSVNSATSIDAISVSPTQRAVVRSSSLPR